MTDQAIVDAVLALAPESVLDIGCGEGWLLRSLAPHVTRLVGIDAVPDFIKQAQASGTGEFILSTYEALPGFKLTAAFDVVVCNFSLIGKESVEAVFRAAPNYLNANGAFIVQTLHPAFAGVIPYEDGWQDGSWAGFGPDFSDPAPWYFRTLESWVALFNANGLQIQRIQEPVNPTTGQPASILFTATAD